MLDWLYAMLIVAAIVGGPFVVGIAIIDVSDWWKRRRRG